MVPLTPEKYATMVLAGVVIAVGIWDIVAVVCEWKGGTVSETIWSYSTRYPAVPFFSGMVAGHLFWR